MGLRAVIVHELADAEAALRAAEALGVPVILLSAPGAAAYAGAGWFAALIGHAGARCPQAKFTAMLDCAARADLVQAALRQGLKDVIYTGPGATAARLADIARRCGARLHPKAPPALDLFAAADRAAACRAWLDGD